MRFLTEAERLRAREAADATATETYGPTGNPDSDPFLSAFDRLYPEVPMPTGPLLTERYWCGCVREARWLRCEQHPELEQDEEPERQKLIVDAPDERDGAR